MLLNGNILTSITKLGRLAQNFIPNKKSLCVTQANGIVAVKVETVVRMKPRNFGPQFFGRPAVLMSERYKMTFFCILMVFTRVLLVPDKFCVFCTT